MFVDAVKSKLLDQEPICSFLRCRFGNVVPIEGLSLINFIVLAFFNDELTIRNTKWIV